MNNRELKKILSSVRTQVVANPQWKAHQREILLTSIKAQVGNRQAPSLAEAKIWQKIGGLMLRPVGAFGVAMMVIFGGVIASVSASSNSLPGDLLYPLKLTSEKIQVSLASNKKSKANLELSFAKKRIVEITEVVKRSQDPVKTQEKIKKPLESYKSSIATIKLAIEESKNDNDDKAIILAEQLKEVAQTAAASVKSAEVTVAVEDPTKTDNVSVKKAIAEVVTTSTDAQLGVIKLLAEKDLVKAKEELEKYLVQSRSVNEAIIKADEDRKTAEVAAEKVAVETEKVAVEVKTLAASESVPTEQTVNVSENAVNATPAPEEKTEADVEQALIDEQAELAAKEAEAAKKSQSEAEVALAKAEIEKITKAEELLKKDDVLGALAILLPAELNMEEEKSDETVNNETGDKSEETVKSESVSSDQTTTENK